MLWKFLTMNLFGSKLTRSHVQTPVLDGLAPLKHSALCSSEGSVQTKGLHQEVALATWSLRGFWTRYLEDPFYWATQAVKRPAALWKHWQRSGFPFSCQGTQVLSHLSMLHNLAIWAFEHLIISWSEASWTLPNALLLFWLCWTQFILSFQRLKGDLVVHCIGFSHLL